MGSSKRRAYAWIVAVAIAAPLIAALSAWAAPGDLDRSFGTDGIARGPAGSYGAAALQRDGRIVAVGARSDYASLWRMARLRTDGTVDSTFGSSGIVDVGCSSICFASPRAVAIQADGRIVVIGVAAMLAPEPGPPHPGPYSSVVRRFQRDGAPDESLAVGDPFWVTAALPSALLPLPGGKTMVAGSQEFSGGALVLARFDARGVFDASFGMDGQVVAHTGDFLQELTALPDGRFLGVGQSTPDPETRFSSPLLLRLRNDGSPDLDFGVDGRVVLNLDPDEEGSTWALVVQPDGKTVVGGSGRNGSFMARFDRKGALDPSFGSNGVVRSSLLSHIADLLRQEDGKLVAVGSRIDDVEARTWVVARFTATGAPDPGFGDGGRVSTDPDPEANAYPRAVFGQAGKILVVGSSGQLVAVRYQGDSSSSCRRSLPSRRAGEGTAGDETIDGATDGCPGSGSGPTTGSSRKLRGSRLPSSPMSRTTLRRER